MIKQLESNIYGLNYIPQLPFAHLNDQDCVDREWLGNVPWANKKPNTEFSDNNHAILRNEILLLKDKLKDKFKLIVEIGVSNARCGHQTEPSTHTILKYKPEDCIYIGIDIDDKSYLNNHELNSYTIQSDSLDADKQLTDLMYFLGVDKIDLLMIDGHHSIKHVLHDFGLARFLSDYGVVVLHDTSIFPGPFFVTNAINTELFNVTRYFDEYPDDWGIAVARHRKYLNV